MTAAGSSRFDGLLARLKAGAECLPLCERRRLVATVAQAIRAGDGGDGAISLFCALASDPKWEVRQDVAEALPLVPDEHFVELAGRLVADDNRYVKAAAESSLDRRRRTRMDAERASRGMAQVSSQLAALARRHGEAAATEAMRLSEEQLDMVGKEIAHDLLNLLTPVKDYARSLRAELAGDSNGGEIAGRIVDGLELLHRSIRDVQSYCEPVPLERHVEDLGELIRMADEMARANVREDGGSPDGVMVRIEVPADCRVTVCRHAIIKAFVNVLKNSHEACASRRRATIRVTAAYTASDVEVAVRDNGPGLSAENLRKLKQFLPGRKNMAKRRSTGYGLLIARRAVEAHRGLLDIQSRPGRGTTVTICLPLGPEGGEE